MVKTHLQANTVSSIVFYFWFQMQIERIKCNCNESKSIYFKRMSWLVIHCELRR